MTTHTGGCRLNWLPTLRQERWSEAEVASEKSASQSEREERAEARASFIIGLSKGM